MEKKYLASGGSASYVNVAWAGQPTDFVQVSIKATSLDHQDSSEEVIRFLLPPSIASGLAALLDTAAGQAMKSPPIRH